MVLGNKKKFNKKYRWCKNVSDIIQAVSSVLMVVIALYALLVVIQPSLNPSNRNHFEKANAGVPYSQFFLANHYYEVGDFQESIYWYKLASADVTEYQASAYNNLGYLYAFGYGAANIYEFENYRYEYAISLFKDAASHGNNEALMNFYILFHTMPPTSFINDYSMDIEWVEANLIEKGLLNQVQSVLFIPNTRWEYIGTKTYINELKYSNETIRYILLSTQDVMTSDNEYETVRTYDVYNAVKITSEWVYSGTETSIVLVENTGDIRYISISTDTERLGVNTAKYTYTYDVYIRTEQSNVLPLFYDRRPI